jgi:hypothetical protein
MTAATFPRPFVPIAELPGADLEPGSLETPEFIARQITVLDARRRQGMNLAVMRDGGRIVQIAPDGTETDVTAELDRRVARAREQLGWAD